MTDGRTLIDERQEDTFHQQTLLITGFLGGIALTCLVLVLGSKGMFDIDTTLLGSAYFPFLIISLSLVSFVSILGSMSAAILGAYGSKSYSLVIFSLCCLDFMAAMFTYILPILLLPFIGNGAFLVLITNAVLLTIFLYLWSRAARLIGKAQEDAS